MSVNQQKSVKKPCKIRSDKGTKVSIGECKSHLVNYLDRSELECAYNTTITCKECRYGAWGGRKSPESFCNQNYQNPSKDNRNTYIVCR